MYLDLDVGNSFIKYRYVNAGENKNFDVQVVAGLSELQYQLQTNTYSLDSIRLASVRSLEVTEKICQYLTQQFKCGVINVRVDENVVSGACGYQDVSQLGVDRWLAIIAVRELYASVVLIDLGTATKIELIEKGQHLGGYIAPSCDASLEALLGNTDIPANHYPEEVRAVDIAPGRSTKDCLLAGVTASLLGCIQVALMRHPVKSPQVVFTGGRKELALSCIAYMPEAVYVPNLVLEGLAQYSQALLE